MPGAVVVLPRLVFLLHALNQVGCGIHLQRRRNRCFLLRLSLGDRSLRCRVRRFVSCRQRRSLRLGGRRKGLFLSGLTSGRRCKCSAQGDHNRPVCRKAHILRRLRLLQEAIPCPPDCVMLLSPVSSGQRHDRPATPVTFGTSWADYRRGPSHGRSWNRGGPSGAKSPYTDGSTWDASFGGRGV